MIDPYRMVVVNIIASLIVLLGTFIYKFIYPKKKINLFTLLLVISLLPVISILRSGSYESGDFNIHIYRIISFSNVLKEGIIMPSWAADLNSSYGNPLFIFNYSLPYYFISFFHFVGIDFINATKLYLGLIMYFSSITMFLAVKEITNNKFAAFVSAIFYLFSPYHLIDVHFRATLGESTIFLVAPLIFLLITKYLKSGKYYWIILNSLITAMLVMAHPLLAICFCVVASLYILFTGIIYRKIKYVLLSISSLILGGIISSYVWISFIIFAPYMYEYQSFANLSEKMFYHFEYLFFSPWRYGLLFQGPKGELAQIIGYTQLLVVAILIILFLTNKIKSSLKFFVLFWIIIFFFTIFLMHPLSIFFWKPFELFWMLLPYGRLSLVLTFCTSILAGYFAIIYPNTNSKKYIVFFIIFLAIGYTILNWGHRRILPQASEEALARNVGKSTIYEGILVGFLNNKWADPNNFWFSTPPKNHLDVTTGKGSIKEVGRTSVKHEYVINAQTPVTIRENTLYYPGWSLEANGKNISIYPGYRGIIYANLPKGLLHVKLTYKDIPIYMLSKVLGITLFLTLIVLTSISFFIDRKVIKINLSRFSSKPKHFAR
ncbi:MAG: hypothetical protein COX78_01080 [Candidatus Levybacteria bacterium CG_4_10_14_0_2_um_filter_35_8]|nr:MAG: hypothetical protein COX78_01080 [Candidatus Levybacteria bacterium CG_4_10_14_0_2_um_filter_35_8]